MMTTKYLDIFEVAEVLGVTPETVRKNMKRRPWLVPMNMHIPGTRMLRWRIVDVEAWLVEKKQDAC